jgi:hypothetical protein
MSPKYTVVAIILLSLVNFCVTTISEIEWGSPSEVKAAKEAVRKTIGMPSIALSLECPTTRNPVLESLCECLGDLPGGGCYHVDCLLVTPQPLEGDQIEVLTGGAEGLGPTNTTLTRTTT